MATAPSRPTLTLFMAMSLNGVIARKNGEEDFLSHENWLTFLALLKEHDGLIWGRRTYEAVQQWGTDFRVDTPITVLSHTKKNSTAPNVHFVSSPGEAVEYFRIQGKRKILLSGGATTNTSFAKAGLINEIIINVEPVVVGEGISLFSPEKFDLQLSLLSMEEHKTGIATLHYSVTK